MCSHPNCYRPPAKGRKSGLCSMHKSRKNKGLDMDAPIMKAEHGALLSFLDGLIDRTDKECIAWPFARHPQTGYPSSVLVSGRQIRPAHYILEKSGAKKPSPLHEAAHSCGKGHLGCINPSHLRWATKKENVSDKYIHGTILIGSNHQNSKLNEEAVTRIQSLLQEGLGDLKIARMYGVSSNAIRQVRLGITWRHAL